MSNKTSLYLYDISKASQPLPEEVFSADELAHFEKMSSDKRRHEFLHGRLLIKSVLKNLYAVKNPTILKKKSGKPYVRGFKINLSHSSDYLALAVSKDVEIGVDIEQSGPKKHFLKIAEQYFSATENKFIRAPKDLVTQEWRFKNIWCLKEAFIKTIGGKIDKKSLSISFDLLKNKIESSPSRKELQFHLCEKEHLTVCSEGRTSLEVFKVRFDSGHKPFLAKTKLKFISLT
jgi:Phosphopantetheinyl transferase